MVMSSQDLSSPLQSSPDLPSQLAPETCCRTIFFAGVGFVPVATAFDVRLDSDGASVPGDALVEAAPQVLHATAAGHTGRSAASRPVARQDARASLRMCRRLFRRRIVAARPAHAGAVLCPRQSRRIGAAPRRLGKGRNLQFPNSSPRQTGNIGRHIRARRQSRGRMEKARKQRVGIAAFRPP